MIMEKLNQFEGSAEIEDPSASKGKSGRIEDQIE